MKLIEEESNEQEMKLSSQDIALKRYIELSEQIKELSKELDRLKKDFKHRGTFSTRNYVCSVEERVRTNPPAVSVLIDRFGPSAEEICTKSTYKMVKVSRKGE